MAANLSNYSTGMNTDGQDDAIHKRQPEVLIQPMLMDIFKANMTKKHASLTKSITVDVNASKANNATLSTFSKSIESNKD